MKTGVLVVEDHPCTGAVYSVLLGQCYYRVTLATTLAEGRQALSDQPHTCIVDINLPDGSGLDLVREIRGELPGCRAIVVTANPTPAVHDAAREAGAYRVLEKPVSFRQLFDLLPPPQGAGEPVESGPEPLP